MTPERLHIIKTCLQRRQPDLTVVMENVCKPHNLAAVARTLEAVGGLEIHAISQLRSLRLSQMSAAGIRKWISVKKHADIATAASQLKAKGFRIIATTLSDRAVDYREPDYTHPCAILMGEEYNGISEQAAEIADEHITIPMVGMVQSLNVSVAAALVLYEAYRQRETAGQFQHCKLDAASYNRLLFEACHPQVAKYCRQKGIAYPAMDENAEIIEPVEGSGLREHEGFSDWVRES